MVCRLVHLDLKGAPPKLSYYDWVCQSKQLFYDIYYFFLLLSLFG